MRIVVKGQERPAAQGPELEPIITRDQLAAAWGVSPHTIMRRILDGKLPPYDDLMVKYKGWYVSTLRKAGIRFQEAA
jgi:hypothetical protein